MTNFGFLTELTWEDMRNVRRGYYEYKSHGLTLDGVKEVNIGRVIKRAQLELSEGLLYLGYIFPHGSDQREALEPIPSEVE